MGFIIRFLVSRPLLERLILFFIIMVAIVSAFGIKRLAYPRVDFERLTITTVYPGASPEDAELNVTVKLEESLEEVDGIEKYTSSSIENLSIINVFIDPDSEDKEKVKSDIRRAIDSVTDLPEEVKDRPYVFEHKMENYPIFEVSLTIPGNDEKILRFHAKRLKKKLIELDSVSRIWQRGIRDREFKILLNKRKMDKYEISFEEVMAAIKQNTIRASGGFVESFTSEKGIVTLSEFYNPDTIENIIVRTSEMGDFQIKIRDIGVVLDGFVKKDVIVRDNGKEGIALWATKKKTADILAIADEIKACIASYKKNHAPKNLSIETTYDDSVETKNRLFIVYSNALVGFFLVIIVLFFFLDKRIAFWTSVGIPISISITLMVLKFMDISINSISLCGMVVVLGMVVDDAIIIAESIFRAREQGMEPVEASIYGLKMVVRPVIGTIITTIIAFFPIYFIPGTIGDFSIEIPTIVIVMLLASLIEATLILPVHLAHGPAYDKKNTTAPRGQKLLNLLELFYTALLQKALNHRFKSLLALMAFLIIGTLIALKVTNFNMFPLDQAYRMWVHGKCSKDSNLDYTAKQSMAMEEIISSLPKDVVISYKTTVGRFFNESGRASNSFYTRIIMTPSTTRSMTATDVKKYILRELKKRKIKTIKDVNFYIDGGGPPVGKPVEIQVIGNDNEKRKEIIKELMAGLKDFGIIEATTDYREGKEEIRVLPNHKNIAIANLNVTAIAATIRTAIDGTIIASLKTPEDTIDYRVMLDRESKGYADPLKDLHVRNPYGKLVPLKNLIHEKKGFSPQNIYHYNSDRTNKISGNVDLKKTTPKEVYEKLKTRYKDFEKKYPGFKLIIGGEAEESARMFSFMIKSITVSVIAIYFILVLQFNSFVQPVMVIMAIPFGLVGLMIMFAIHGQDLSLLAMVGILGFGGVVVNDSLIMVDFINRTLKNDDSVKRVMSSDNQIDDGDDDISRTKNLVNIIVQGARYRLRPIVLTTVTTVAGLVPTAYGLLGGKDSFVSPMVLAMSWGLIVGTTATLLAIPVFYLFIYNVVNTIKAIPIKDIILSRLPFVRS